MPNTMLKQLTSGIDTDMVKGDIKALAAAGIGCVLFDLGPSWDAYEAVGIYVDVRGPSSGLSGVSLWGSDAALPTNQIPVSSATCRRLSHPNATGFGIVNQASMTVAAGPQAVVVRPWGRYIAVSFTNADGSNATGAASFMSLVGYPRGAE